jgi:prepilin-type N-terminal cleavage/methylation domain-containing protein
MRNKQGFTMVELLVVLVIVAILAAVATPIYLANVQRSRASEAVSTMGLVRQALRDYQVNANTYFDIAAGDIEETLPLVSNITLADGSVSTTSGVNVNAAVAKYFSNDAFSVEAAGTGVHPNPTGDSTMFATPNVVDFLISTDGSASVGCTLATDTDCATNQNEVDDYRLEMDNSGRVFVSYDAGTTWAAY